MIDGINKDFPQKKWGQMASVRDMLWREKDSSKEAEWWKKVVGDFIKTGSKADPEKLHRKERPRKFAEPPTSPYPEGTPPVHSVEVKDRKKFGDTLFNKHKGSPVPLDPDSKLAKLYHPDSHNIVAFKDVETGEHFLHGRLSEAGGKVHLNPTPMKKEWGVAYDFGYTRPEAAIRPNFVGGVEQHLQRLGASDAANFRPHGHSIRDATNPEMDMQEDAIHEHLRHRPDPDDFFSNVHMVASGHTDHFAKALKEMFNERLKSGDDHASLSSLTDDAAKALSAEHVDDESLVPWHYAHKSLFDAVYPRAVSRAADGELPETTHQDYRDHVQAMIDKHRPESRWATRK
jgi:hypothetical protein